MPDCSRTAWPILLIAGTGLAGPAAAQVRPDSAVTLPPITVPATRTAAPAARRPSAIGSADTVALRRGQPTLGLDEALNGIPGVYAANRYNYSLDQRLSIRGAGSRANFGTRGIRILLDGVPQTLPDGQSQLTNVDLAALDRIEVLRGPAGALYGNASGGVIALVSAGPPAAPFTASTRTEAGSFGLVRSTTRLTGRGGQWSGGLAATWLDIDGFRDHSRAEQRQLALVTSWAPGPRALLTLRATHTAAPRADNPGALTLAELRSDPRAAAPNNLAREAGKDVDQQQASVTLRLFGPDQDLTEVTTFGFRRRLRNPLATGTTVTIDRLAGGARVETRRRLTSRLDLTAGLDLQAMRDDRRNRAADTLSLDQRETVTEVGPFAQAAWTAGPVTVLAGARYDRITFTVADAHLADGGDQSGTRTLQAWSGMAGASLAVSPRFMPYASLATAFETPTTTELANAPSGSGGFNRSLGPQRSVSVELGARGRAGAWDYSAAAFAGRIRDAIVQFEETGGRAYFRNAGKVHADGLEAGLRVAPSPRWSLAAAYTFARYRFADYVVVRAAGSDTLDGNTLAGVPRHFLRVTLRAAPLPRLWIDLDHTLSGSLYADDANAIRVDGWGAGITTVRVSWSTRIGRWTVAPFGGMNNVFDRAYVSSVTINGFNGRVYEPGAARNLWIGAEVGIGGEP